MNLDGAEVLTQIKINNQKRRRGPQIFFATELQLAPGKTDTNTITPAFANHLNKVGVDDYSAEQKEIAAKAKRREGTLTRQQLKRIEEREREVPVVEPRRGGRVINMPGRFNE